VLLLTFLGAVSYLIRFTNSWLFTVIPDAYQNWYDEHVLEWNLLMWVSLATFVLFNWLFVSRYVFSSWKLPCMLELARLYFEMMRVYLQQRQDQAVTFSVSQLQEINDEKTEIKKK